LQQVFLLRPYEIAKDVKKYSLQFTSFIYLTAFRKYSKAAHWEIDITNLVAHCNCSEKEAKFACNEFRAILLTGNEVINVSNQNWEVNAESYPRHAS
jgi:hypothetical protein